MRQNNGFVFLAGCILALVAFVTLAPIIPPPPGPGGVETEVDPVASAVNGLLKSNGTTLSAATANTDYSNPAGVQALIDAVHGGTYETHVTTGGTTTLTVASPFQQFFTGTGDGEAVKLPVTSTLSVGFSFLIVNNDSAALLIKPSGPVGSVLSLPAGASAIVTCILASGTGVSSWNAKQISGYAPLDSPAFIGSPTAITQSLGDNSTKLATTAYVDTSLPVVDSGTYNPSPSNEVNLDAAPTFSVAQYLRVGNVVTVSGRFQADPNLTATVTSFRMTLPIASNFAQTGDLGGTAAGQTIIGNIAGISANVGGDAVVGWRASDVTIQSWFYSFTYLIIP